MLKSIAAAIILALPLTLAAPSEQSDEVTWEFIDEQPAVEENNLQSRAYNGDITYFYPGLGSCGWYNGENDMIAALSHIIYQSQNPCGRMIRVKGPKGSVDVKVVDKCMGCAQGSVDLSPAAFRKAVGDLGLGRKQGSWTFI